MPNNHGGARKPKEPKREKTIKASAEHLADLFGSLPREQAQALWDAHLALAQGLTLVAYKPLSGKQAEGTVQEECEIVDSPCESCLEKFQKVILYHRAPDKDALRYMTDRLLGKPVVASPEHPRPVFILNSAVPGWGAKKYEITDAPEELEPDEAEDVEKKGKKQP